MQHLCSLSVSSMHLFNLTIQNLHHNTKHAAAEYRFAYSHGHEMNLYPATSTMVCLLYKHVFLNVMLQCIYV